MEPLLLPKALFIFSIYLLSGNASADSVLHASRLNQLEKNWLSASSAPIREIQPGEPLTLRCLETTGDAGYVGALQKQIIHAPLSAVATVLNDVDKYDQLFPDYKRISLTRKEGTHWETVWEQIVPFPFIPNVRFQLNYDVSEPPLPHGQEIRTYRYTLARPGQVTANDGLIVLESRQVDGKAATIYTEVDFLNANWSVLKVLGYKKIWTNCLRGLAQADSAIRLKAEHPDLKYGSIQNQADKLIPEGLIDSCYNQRQPSASLGL